MIIVERGAYPQEGVGKPDYSKGIARGQVRAGISVEYNQILKMFVVICHSTASPFAWCRAQLAIGEMCHLVDVDTGIAIPWTLSAGYTIDVIDRYISCDGDVELTIYFDTYLAICPGTITAGQSQYINQVQPYSSRTLDPTGALPHDVDGQLLNVAGAAINAASTVITTVTAVGTEPLPDTKPIKCKHCGNIDQVPYQTTYHICTRCGELTIVYNMRDFKYTL